MLKEYKVKKKGFMLALLSVIIRSVELNFDSIEVDVGKRQKIAFAKLHRIGKAFLSQGNKPTFEEQKPRDELDRGNCS